MTSHALTSITGDGTGKGARLRALGRSMGILSPGPTAREARGQEVDTLIHPRDAPFPIGGRTGRAAALERARGT